METRNDKGRQTQETTAQGVVLPRCSRSRIPANKPLTDFLPAVYCYTDLLPAPAKLRTGPMERRSKTPVLGPSLKESSVHENTQPHYHIWIMHREHSITAFGTDPVLRRLAQVYDHKTSAVRGLADREGKVMTCTEVHSLDQLLVAPCHLDRPRRDHA